MAALAVNFPFVNRCGCCFLFIVALWLLTLFFPFFKKKSYLALAGLGILGILQAIEPCLVLFTASVPN